MCGKMAISAYILKIVEKDPFLTLQMRAKEMFNRHQFLARLQYMNQTRGHMKIRNGFKDFLVILFGNQTVSS